LKVSTVHFGTDQSSGLVESCHSGPCASLSPPSRSPPPATFLYARRSHRWLPALYSTTLRPPSVTRYNRYLALRAICQTPFAFPCSVCRPHSFSLAPLCFGSKKPPELASAPSCLATPLLWQNPQTGASHHTPSRRQHHFTKPREFAVSPIHGEVHHRLPLSSIHRSW
jgi:hypothetical protein